jgi:dihydrodipicolinate synthase/N-acetylneuraminate lyase
MKFDGIYTPVITPHREDGSIDRDAVATQVESLIGQGVHGLINGGSTGEYYAQSLDDRMDIAAFVKEVIGDRVPLIVGTEQFGWKTLLPWPNMRPRSARMRCWLVPRLMPFRPNAKMP